MGCADGLEGSVCDVMQEAGIGIASFFTNSGNAFLTLSIIITTILIFIAVMIVVVGFLKKARSI